MSISGYDPDFVPVDVSVDDEMIRVKFNSGLELATPVARYGRLQRATPEQRKAWRLIGKGDGIHWPDVDEDISVRGLFLGARRVPSASIEAVPALIGELYKTTNTLSGLFKDQPFTLDGHLVGSIGQVVAQYIYGLTLEPAGTPGINARKDGKTMQVKLTGEDSTSYGVRWSNKEKMTPPDLLLCLKLTKSGFEEVYNGPFPVDLLREKKDQANGQISISLKVLKERNPSLLHVEKSFDSINRWFAPQLSHVA